MKLQKTDQLLREAKAKAAAIEDDPAKQAELLEAAQRPFGGAKVILVLNSLQRLAALDGRVTRKFATGELQAEPVEKDPQVFWELPMFSDGTVQVAKVRVCLMCCCHCSEVRMAFHAWRSTLQDVCLCMYACAMFALANKLAGCRCP